VLGTPADRELRAGLMESVKRHYPRPGAGAVHGKNAPLILGRDAIGAEKVIAASIRMKAGVVNIDERESGLRMILNLATRSAMRVNRNRRTSFCCNGEAWRGE